MKLLISTVGSFHYVDPQSGDELHHNRPSVVRMTNFVQALAGSGKIKVHSNEVVEDATDAQFADFWIESDRKEELALDSFLSKYSVAQPAKESASSEPEADAASEAAEAEAPKADKPSRRKQ